jgi:hypothetical protein
MQPISDAIWFESPTTTDVEQDDVMNDATVTADTASLYSGSLSRPQALNVAAAASAPTVLAIVGSLGSADTEPEPPEPINRWEPYRHVMVLREISKGRAAVERAAACACV